MFLLLEFVLPLCNKRYTYDVVALFVFLRRICFNNNNKCRIYTLFTLFVFLRTCFKGQGKSGKDLEQNTCNAIIFHSQSA